MLWGVLGPPVCFVFALLAFAAHTSYSHTRSLFVLQVFSMVVIPILIFCSVFVLDMFFPLNPHLLTGMKGSFPENCSFAFLVISFPARSVISH